MKLEKISLTFAAALALGLAGCSKNEPVTPPDEAHKAAGSPADAVAKTAEAAQAEAATADAAKAAEATKAEAMKQQAEAQKLAAEKTAAEKTAADKLAQTAAAAAPEQARIQSLIDTAKNLTGQNKYAEALKIIGELSNLKLSPEQQVLVDGLKQTAEKQAAQAVTDQAATGASKAIGDVLGGKK
jgi:ATPase subunit of ABC transporter with duplicated ATPase domains